MRSTSRRQCAQKAAQAWASLAPKGGAAQKTAASPAAPPPSAPARRTRRGARSPRADPPVRSPAPSKRAGASRRVPARPPPSTAGDAPPVGSLPARRGARRARSSRADPRVRSPAPSKRAGAPRSPSRRPARPPPSAAGDAPPVASPPGLGPDAPTTSPAALAAFLAHRPKLPVYRKANLLQGTRADGAKAEDDIFDLETYGPEEFGPEPARKVRAKRKPRKPRKQRGHIILAFGSQARENVAPILKVKKNLRTPAAAPTRRLPLVPVNAGASPQLPPARPVPAVGVRPDSPASPLWAPSPVYSPPTAHLTPARVAAPNLPGSADTPGSRTVGPSYRTPWVPRHVRPGEGHVSTPRHEEKRSALNPDLSNRELVQMAFGFEAEDDEWAPTESWLGISPVRGPGVHAMMSPASSVGGSAQPAKTVRRTQAHRSDGDGNAGGPYRFILPTTSRARGLPSRRSAHLSQSTFGSEPSRTARPHHVPSLPSMDRGRSIPPPTKIIRAPPEDSLASSSSTGLSEPSLYGDVEKSISPHSLNDSRPASPPAGPELAMSDADDEEEESVQGQSGTPDAFTVLRNSSIHQSLGKRSCLRPKTKKARRPAAQSGAQPQKQSLIYEVVPNATLGPQKQLKGHHKRKADTSGELSSARTHESESEAPEGKRQRTYCRKPLNTSASASPVKKPLKRNKKIEAWASLQSSHFSEVEGFDLSFI